MDESVAVQFRLRCDSVKYRQGFVEVVGQIHPKLVSLETWQCHSDADLAGRDLKDEGLAESDFVANTELELTPAQARSVATALTTAAAEAQRCEYSARLIVPTDPFREAELGRIALWLHPEDLRWLSKHCCCAPEAREEERQRCLRLRFRASAALHKAGLADETRNADGDPGAAPDRGGG